MAVPAASPAASSADDRAIARAAAAAAGVISGVHALGTEAGRRFAGAVTAASGRATDAGVRVQARDGGVGVTITVVVEYPRNVREVAEQVRTGVAAAVAPLVGGRLDVDVVVTDVHGPFDVEQDDDQEPSAAEGAATSGSEGAPAPVPAAAAAPEVPAAPVASAAPEHVRPAAPVSTEDRVAVVGERAAAATDGDVEERPGR